MSPDAMVIGIPRMRDNGSHHRVLDSKDTQMGGLLVIDGEAERLKFRVKHKLLGDFPSMLVCNPRKCRDYHSGEHKKAPNKQ